MKDIELAKSLCRKFINEYELVINGKSYELVSIGIHIQFRDHNKEDFDGDHIDTYVTPREKNDKPLHWFIKDGPHSSFIDINLENERFYGGLRVNQISNNEEYGTGRLIQFIKNKTSTKIADLNQKAIRQNENELFLRRKPTLNIHYKTIIERPRYLGIYDNSKSFNEHFYFKNLELSTDFESLPVSSENMFFPLCSLPYILQGKHIGIKGLNREMIANFIEAFKIGTELSDEYDLIKKCSALKRDLIFENCLKYGFYLSKGRV